MANMTDRKHYFDTVSFFSFLAKIGKVFLVKIKLSAFNMWTAKNGGSQVAN